MSVKLITRYVKDFVGEHELAAIEPQVQAAHKLLMDRNGPGNDFLGWVDLPENYDKEEFARIKAAAARIQADCDVLVVIGIGGSYLGARAALELLKTPYYNNLPKKTPDIYFAGNSISPDSLNTILKLCEGKRVCVNVISKSGTTTEPALAFRVFRELLEERYGKDGAKSRIYATTDKARGTLKELSDREGYETFVIADDVGGRYSVLTAVGLLPMAVAGIDIDAVMKGAAEARKALAVEKLCDNDCLKYAALRNILYRKGKQIELLVSYEPAFTMMNEWFKQLYGESEGKDNKGLFPASVVCSTDLHSMGQYIQEGRRCLFETVVSFQKAGEDFFVKDDPENLDGLNFLSNQNMSIVNKKAMEGTILAHTEGGVPNLVLEVPEINEHEFGWLVYFFEKACAISGYLLAVNPFNQPGVESYKKNMFALLGKPGYEDRKAELEAKLS
ncbi:MAG: glucose-6-phosphate isomerase [Oscillospiraceae bacterium]|jgi:glucose-6-phosphate isomerase|nr:glucose-6-phosphate isomerase [Oscillospiraceae bacterium]MCI9364159.1 glucose-6-phosphate isomerase [Oscillospiraceae bacterium]MCI9668786.1 glucose-6-phosphate isomerase [Oscillospiraceae bacterium]RKJ57543.1 glucose-6-phosphate isomerase [bacterium 1XD42-8]RKJ65611.1 glucose-6-phosphate isomerase [bacterium 1XD42-1]